MEDNVIIIALKKKNKRNSRPKGVKSWLLKRSHVNLLSDLRLEPTDWNNYLRMDEATYFEILHIIMVTPLIKHSDTVMREAISPHERLSATLLFVATGRN